MATPLLSMQLPPAAADLTLRHMDLLLCLKKLQQRRQATTYRYWGWLGLSPAQARNALSKLEAAGLAVSRVLKDGRNTIGKLWSLTEEGRAVAAAYGDRAPKAKGDDGRGGECGTGAAPTPARHDLHAAMSEKGRGALRAALTDPIHGRVVDMLQSGTVPDTEQLVAWGVRDTVARDISASAARVAAKLANTAPADRSSDTGETKVAAATDEDVDRARRAGVPVPVIEAGEGDNAAAIAQAARLLVHEAAARRPELLQRGVLLGKLPQMVWAMLQGAVADYGSLLKRARALLRWLAEDRFQVPKGYEAKVGAAIRARLCISEPTAPPSVESSQLLPAGMYYTYGLEAAAPSAQGFAA